MYQPPQADATAPNQPPVAGAAHVGPPPQQQLQMQLGAITTHMNQAVSQLMSARGVNASTVAGIERTHAGLVEEVGELEQRVQHMGDVQGEYAGVAQSITKLQGDAELLIGAVHSELKGVGRSGVQLGRLGQAANGTSATGTGMWMWLGAALLVAGGGAWWILRQRRVMAAP